MPDVVTARFDDLRPRRRRSFALSDPERVIVARSVDEVPGTIRAAEQAVAGGSWVAGYVAYEAAPAFDDALEVHGASGTPFADLPLAWFSVHGSRAPTETDSPGSYSVGEWGSETDETAHAAAIERIHRHIEDGDAYQVNHTFRLATEFQGDPAGLYLDLARAQSCGYGSFIDTGRWVIASASPELFFEWGHGRIVSKPMKGTARRGVDLADDERRRQELAASEKDRAENLMIVDMVRNDLGRIARVGTVEAPELFAIEKYDTVWQMTSTVTARPREEAGLMDVFSALFPCASITGAPKVATMRIIRTLETGPRGVYCGAVGFGGPGPDGPRWAFNVAIRTALLDRETGIVHYGTGGGVTYDSTAGGEYAEALLKAELLRRSSSDFKLLETMRWDPGSGFADLALHLGRLADAAWYFDVPVDPAEVRAALDAATRNAGRPCRVRLLVDRSGWIRAEATPVPPPPDGPVRLAVDDRPVDPGDPFLFHKTTNRRRYDEALARRPDVDDVVLWNPDGRATETCIANLACRIDGLWWTPPVGDGLLPGTARRRMLDQGDIGERSITLDELRAADGIARLNAVRGWEAAELAER